MFRSESINATAQVPRWLSKPTCALLLGTLIVRSVAVGAGLSGLEADTDGYRAMATDFLARGQLEIGGNPTAFRPPLYPLVLAGWGALFGLTPLAIGALHVLLAVATVGLVVGLGQQWKLGRAAQVAGALVACDPILVFQSTQVMTETLAALLATITLAALTNASQRRSLGYAAAAGVALALSALCRPSFLLWGLVGVIALGPMARRRAAATSSARLAGWKLSAVCAAGLVAGMLPWAVRNQVRLGTPVVTTTHGGYTLWLANNSDFYEFLRAGNWGDVWTAEKLESRWHQETARLTVDGELERDRLAYQLARRDISREPAMFAYACLARLGRLWGLVPHRTTASESRQHQALRYVVGLGYAVEHACLLVGLAVLLRQGDWRSGWPWGVLLIVALSAAQLPYWTDLRMRAPMVPAACLFSAVGAVWLAAQIGRRKPK